MNKYPVRQSVISALQKADDETNHTKLITKQVDVRIDKTSGALSLKFVSEAPGCGEDVASKFTFEATFSDMGTISIVTNDGNLLAELAQGEATEQEDVQVHLLREDGAVQKVLESAGVNNLDKACFTLHQAIKFVIDQKLLPINGTLIATCFVIKNKKGEKIMAFLILQEGDVLTVGLIPIQEDRDILGAVENDSVNTIRFLIVVPDKKP